MLKSSLSFRCPLGKSAVTALLATIAIAGVGSAEEPTAGPTVHALLLSGGNRIDERVQKKLAQAGIEVVTRPVEEPLSRERLRLFHLVILADCGGLNVPFFGLYDHLSNYFTLARNIDLLHEYVAAGGGLFFQPMMGGAGLATSESYRPLLDPWGIGIPPAGVRDDAHAYDAFSWTENVADHPTTRGVKRIYYPTNMLRWDDAYATNPLELRSDAWTAVVRGEPSSTAARGFQYTTWMPRPGGAAPPLAAVRSAGQGRVAALGLHGFFTFFYPYFAERDWIGESHTGVINGIVLEEGDGTTRSDVDRLLINLIRWLAEPARAAGMGTYTPETFASLPVLEKAPVPAWLTGWRPVEGTTWFQVLIGARTAYSDGAGTVADAARAARAAGVSLLAFTETFERFPKENWPKLVADCQAASDADFVALPGLDLPDVYGNRYLLLGPLQYPEPFLLSTDGKAMQWTQNFLLGFAHHLPAIHRPGSTPLPHQLYKHFCGIVVATYRDGQQVDNGLPAYLWEAFRLSNPLPLVVHEVFSPEEIAEAAATGQQLYVRADTVANAAWYFRNGHEHYFENTPLFQVTDGPRLTTWSTGGGMIQLTVEGDAPLTEVVLYTNYNLARRWRPQQATFEATVHLNHAQLEEHVLVARDAQGRTVLSSIGKTGSAAGYRNRCSDRQNWIGFRYLYTGTEMSDIDIGLPVFGTDEGKAMWPHRAGPQRGENLLPLFDYPFISPAVDVVEAFVDQRYYRALWEETAFDAEPSHDTTRSRVYRAKVRDYNFPDAPARVKEVEIILLRPVDPPGDREGLFPTFTRVAAQPVCGPMEENDPRLQEGKMVQGTFDLPVGGYAASPVGLYTAGGIIALSEGLRVRADGQIGFIPPDPADGPLPAGTTWRARYVQFNPEEVTAERLRQAMGLSPPRAKGGRGGSTPYQLKLTLGALGQVDFVAHAQAERYGIAGEVVPGGLGYTLPLFIEGLNYNWDAAVWRADGSLTPLGVFEGVGIARLDVSQGGAFFAGNVLRCDAPALRLAVVHWDTQTIQVEAHNPTNEVITATVETPVEITGRVRLRREITVPPGTTVMINVPDF